MFLLIIDATYVKNITPITVDVVSTYSRADHVKKSL